MRLLLPFMLTGCSLFGAPADSLGAAEPVAHLVGCWRSVGPEGDRWSVAYASPGPGVLLGTTRQLRPDGSVSEERERFEVGDDGALGVTSVLDGVARDRFVLDPERSKPHHAVFARQGEGWPSRLGYVRQSQTLRLDLGGEGRVVTMELGAVPCE